MDENCFAVAGQTCTLMCNEGYTPAGGVLPEITCWNDGKWEVQGECNGGYNNNDKKKKKKKKNNERSVRLSWSRPKRLQFFTHTVLRRQG